MIYVLDLLGVAVFAITGALAAGRKKMDGIGVGTLAIVTAIGGGTIRDMLLDRTVFWIADQTYLIVAVLAAIVTMMTARLWVSLEKPLVVADAMGLALFAVIGAQRAMEMKPPVGVGVVLLMGVITGVAGGILRDVLCGEMPYVFRGELYATAALAGCAGLLALRHRRVDEPTSVAASVVICLAGRLAAIRWRLMLPIFHVKHPPSESRKEPP